MAMYAGAIICSIACWEGIKPYSGAISLLGRHRLINLRYSYLTTSVEKTNISALVYPLYWVLSFVALSPMIVTIGSQYGIPAIYGSIIVAGTLHLFICSLSWKTRKVLSTCCHGNCRRNHWTDR